MMADKKADAVERVMDSVDAFGSKIDQLAGKVAALAEKMGPDAKLVFDETLHAYALKGLLGLIVMASVFIIGVGFGMWAVSLAVRAESDKNSGWNSEALSCVFGIGVISLIIGVVSGVALTFKAADLFTRWMYPLGSLILEKL
jgi:hypothetical protein